MNNWHFDYNHNFNLKHHNYHSYGSINLVINNLVIGYSLLASYNHFSNYCNPVASSSTHTTNFNLNSNNLAENIVMKMALDNPSSFLTVSSTFLLLLTFPTILKSTRAYLSSFLEVLHHHLIPSFFLLSSQTF
jgi:hypothetical protein